MAFLHADIKKIGQALTYGLTYALIVITLFCTKHIQAPLLCAFRLSPARIVVMGADK